MVFNAWAKDLGRGLTSLMTAADAATVTALNLRGGSVPPTHVLWKTSPSG